MDQRKPEKVITEYLDGVTENSPLIPRRYTLTHSDETGDIYLQIGLDFTFERASDKRDELLGEWIWKEDGICFYVYLQVSKDRFKSDHQSEMIREKIFRRELPVALHAIRYGDREFFRQYPDFEYFPIMVVFFYHDKSLNKVECWGNFSKYHIL